MQLNVGVEQCQHIGGEGGAVDKCRATNQILLAHGKSIGDELLEGFLGRAEDDNVIEALRAVVDGLPDRGAVGGDSRSRPPPSAGGSGGLR